MSKSNIPIIPIRPVNDPIIGLADDIQRQFDNKPGGGIFDVTESGTKATKDTDNDGQPEEFNNRYLEGETARTVYDYIFDYEGTLNDKEDTEDLFGPTVGEAIKGEYSSKFTIVVVLIAVIALFVVFRPLFVSLGSLLE